MLQSLSIRDIVIIDRLDLVFKDGLCVLTGETGAGKSILLDALGLVIGRRGERALVRQGTDKAIVSAEFALSSDHKVWDQLADQGLDDGRADGLLVLRRIVSADGKSRAFLNDQPVSIGLLGDIGDNLVEIHGQHDDRGLLNPRGHKALLDAFGGLGGLVTAVRRAHEALASARDDRHREEAALATARADEEFLRYNLEELSTLAPEEGEEEQLAARRTLMMKGEKLRGGLNEVLTELTSEGGADALLRGATRRLERGVSDLGEAMDPVLESLERAAIEAGEAIARLEQIIEDLDFDPLELEATEERLFALRAAARKHHCQVDDLPALLEDFSRRIGDLDQGEDRLNALLDAEKRAHATFEAAVGELSAARREAARRLAVAVNEELGPLKLDKARFDVGITALDPSEWGEGGGERVEFQVATNPGAPFGPLMKIASGGEQSRFILALKVVLARQGSAPTLIFDEVDRGVGGAVAEAVGERLARLSGGAQVLVVTHSPQVAAAGRHHWRIAKQEGDAGVVTTRVVPLDRDERKEEIARMLAGARITDEARAAAAQLMRGDMSNEELA